MQRASQALKDYIIHRLNTNAAWKNLNVLFSDSGVPGEGEHKLLQFLRYARTLPDYNPNLHHCIYGMVSSSRVVDVR